MLNLKESIISIILGAFILFLVIGIGSISGTITGSGLAAILLGIIFILKPIVCRRVHSGTIDNAWLFYTNEDGDYKGECIAIRDEDLELLQSILPTKAWLEIYDDFKIHKLGMVVVSKNRKVKIYFNENDFSLIKLSRLLFGADLTEEDSELLKKILKRYLNEL